MDLTARLRDCIHHPQQREKAEGFKSIIADILSLPPAEQSKNLKAYVEAVLDEQVGLVVARQLLSEFISLFDSRITDTDIQKELLSFAIDHAQPRAVSFEEQVHTASL